MSPLPQSIVESTVLSFRRGELQPLGLIPDGNVLLVFGLALGDVFIVNVPVRGARWAGRLTAQ